MHYMILTVLAVTPTAISEPGNINDVVQSIPQMVDALKSGQYGLLAALIIMAVVWGMRTFLLKQLKASVLPWVAAGLGCVAGVGAAFASLPSGATVGQWLMAAVSGLLAGAAASGMWSLIGKHITPKPKDK